MPMVEVSNGGTLQDGDVLWTNPNPSSGISSMTITLNKSMTNFDFLEMEYRAVGANAAISRVIWRVSDFVNYTHPSTGVGGVIEANYGNNAVGVRLVGYGNDTTIYVGTYGTVAGAYVSASTMAIPYRVIGY